ncbi:MAG: exodeoxyribonuclease VII large subunit [Gemmatimonadaceae bacterium]|nr:exodeoxyribonuclease VII large subunit [Gemmatimonadaceae bacterium]
MARSRTSGAGPSVHPDVADNPGSAPESAISVHTLTSAAKDLIEGAFPPLWVRGEVTNFKAHRNGHWYFSLRDADAQVNCVIWSSATKRIPAPPDEGMAVTALGQMTVWPVRGDLQFSVRALEAAGDGLWRKALEQARLRLERDGLLDPARKRALPAFPRRIAVITSPDGAALHDIITVTRGRSRDVELVVIPAKVQGEGAPESLLDALDRVARWGDADLVIMGRGGGSREDLWAFNDERVARALALCPLPTVSAVGHETDISLCDLVADVRAATPSAAAELAVPSRRETLARVDALAKRLVSAAQRREDRAVAALRQVRQRLALAARRNVERRQARLATLASQLQALSPLETLGRGFVVARTPSGATLSRTAEFVRGQAFELWVQDGLVDATVTGHRPLPTLPSDAGSMQSEEQI